MGGMFQIACTASAGVSLTELQTAILTAVAELGAHGPTDSELERGLAQTEAQFIYRLQTVGGFGGKGDQLNAYNTFAGDPGYFDRDRQRYFEVTRSGAAAAVDKWLGHAPSVSLSVVPKGRRDLALSGAEEVHVS
jgi:zinc protease